MRSLKQRPASTRLWQPAADRIVTDIDVDSRRLTTVGSTSGPARRSSWCLAVAIFGCVIGAVLLRGGSPAMAEDQPAEKPKPVTYDDDVRPILREHCFACHNQDQAKSGLALDNYARLMEGGSGGEVVYAEDLDSSRLWALVSHAEEPVMPPGQDKLPEPKLSLIQRWIEAGALENSGSKVKAKTQTLTLATPSTMGKPDGPAAMPENLPRTPIVTTARPAAVSALGYQPLGTVGGGRWPAADCAVPHRLGRVAGDSPVRRRECLFVAIQPRWGDAVGRWRTPQSGRDNGPI